MNANHRYKNSVFTALFSDEEALRELYNAVSGSAYDSSTPISINTLPDVLFLDRMNDISFLIDNRLVVLIEHQSTISANMPLRFLLYIARVYEKLIANKNIYRERLYKIPRPEFIVLYNGSVPMPEEEVHRLSRAFMDDPGPNGSMGNDTDGKIAEPPLELIVKIYNINLGHNEALARKSRTLREYSTFIAKIRENLLEMTLEEAVKSAVWYCTDHNILTKFLDEYGREVLNMLDTPFSLEDFIEVRKEEAWEIGMKAGREAGMKAGREAGMEAGREEGRKKTQVIIADRLRALGIPEDTIDQALGDTV
jgi:hypothetical protein